MPDPDHTGEKIAGVMLNSSVAEKDDVAIRTPFSIEGGLFKFISKYIPVGGLGRSVYDGGISLDDGLYYASGSGERIVYSYFNISLAHLCQALY